MVLCDRSGTRMPAVRATMEAKIGQVSHRIPPVPLLHKHVLGSRVSLMHPGAYAAGASSKNHRALHHCGHPHLPVPSQTFLYPPAAPRPPTPPIPQVYKGLDLSLDCFPADDVADDPEAYLKVGQGGWNQRLEDMSGDGGLGACSLWVGTKPGMPQWCDMWECGWVDVAGWRWEGKGAGGPDEPEEASLHGQVGRVPGTCNLSP
jgi:hypothetical protein